MENLSENCSNLSGLVANKDSTAVSVFGKYILQCCEDSICELSDIFEEPPNNSQHLQATENEQQEAASNDVSNGLVSDVFMGYDNVKSEEYFELLKFQKESTIPCEAADCFEEIFDGKYLTNDYMLFQNLNVEPIDMNDEWIIKQEEDQPIVVPKEEQWIIGQHEHLCENVEMNEAKPKTQKLKSKVKPIKQKNRGLCRHVEISREDFGKFYTPLNGEYRKPPFTYSVLIAFALISSSEKAMEVGNIYREICYCFPYFATAKGHWRNSIRHNLSFTDWFEKTEWTRNAVKGHGWILTPKGSTELCNHCFLDYTKLYHCVSGKEICYLLIKHGLLNAVCED